MGLDWREIRGFGDRRLVVSNRVVVTGIGVISPLGLDVPSTWEGLVAGRSGIDHITLFDASDFEVEIAADNG